MSAPPASPEIASSPAYAAPEPAGRRARPDWLPGAALSIGLAAVLVATAMHAGGGLQLGPLTTVTTGLDVLAGVLCIVALLAAPEAERPWGVVSLGLFAALATLTGLSITWAISPDAAWIETNRTLTWLLLFAAGGALARLGPGRWRALLAGVLLASVAISFYALLTKVFPGTLAEDETYARLREPFGYWNAVGLMAAMGIPIALWMGARREGHAAFAALAYPAIGLLVTTILVAYSRGAIVACAVGLTFWFAAVPMRLRAAAVLIPSAAVGVVTAIWAFGQSGLSDDNVELALRSDAGSEFAVLLAVMLLALTLIGLVVTWHRDRRVWPASTRRAWGIALITLLALAPVALAGALALSERGLGGNVSKAWRDLTDPNANTPKNDPSRLTAIGSVRARYWRDAIDIFKAREFKGVGAGGYAAARLRFRHDDLDVEHAHGYLVQTAADLGLLGLAASLALLAVWLASAYRATVPWRRSDPGYASAERAGLLTLVAVVVAFGAHSLIDWTWFIPGTVAPALLIAGWIAARGPGDRSLPVVGPVGTALRSGVRSPRRVAAAAAVAILVAATAWSTSRPQASVDRVDEALGALADRRPDDARRLVLEAADLDPLSLEPFFALSEIDDSAGRGDAAQADLERAIKLQPSSAAAWIRLANFELRRGDNAGAIRTIRPALYLDPRSPAATAVYLEAYRRGQAAAKAKAEAKAKAKAKTRAKARAKAKAKARARARARADHAGGGQ